MRRIIQRRMNIDPSDRHQRATATNPARHDVLPIIDARTGEAHQVTTEAVDSGRDTGRYTAVCGAEVLAASLTAPPTRYCRFCAEWMTR
jgi:hypothetical protein